MAPMRKVAFFGAGVSFAAFVSSLVPIFFGNGAFISTALIFAVVCVVLIVVGSVKR